MTLWGFKRTPNEISVLPSLRDLMRRPSPPPPPPIAADPTGKRFWLFRLGIGQFLAWLALLALLLGLLYLGPRSCSLGNFDMGPSSGSNSAIEPKDQAPTVSEPTPSDGQLVVPKKSLDSGDLSFLKGGWKSVSELKNRKTYEPLVIYFEFREDGHGESRFVENIGNVVCTGSSFAELRERTLTIQNPEGVLCPSGYRYNPVVIKCVIDAGGAAKCVIHQNGPDVPVTLIRQ